MSDEENKPLPPPPNEYWEMAKVLLPIFGVLYIIERIFG